MQSQSNYNRALDGTEPILENRDYEEDGVLDDYEAMCRRIDSGYYDRPENDSTGEVALRAAVVEIGSVAVRAERRRTRPLFARLAAATIVLWH